jgi:hypothetical protein
MYRYPGGIHFLEMYYVQDTIYSIYYLSIWKAKKSHHLHSQAQQILMLIEEEKIKIYTVEYYHIHQHNHWI